MMGTKLRDFAPLPNLSLEELVPNDNERLIGDRAYDSDPLDAELRQAGIEMIAPHRKNRNKPKTQDGRKLRRYKRRWKVERLFAWLGNFRCLVVRYERRVDNFLGFAYLACIVILLRRLTKRSQGSIRKARRATL